CEQLGDQPGQLFRPAIGRAPLDGNSLPVDVAQLAEALPESLPDRRGTRQTGRVGPYIGDARDPGRLLLARPWRDLTARQQAQTGQGQAALQESAAARVRHWMTSVAWWRTDGGMVSPSAWAVFRLTTKSNVAGCSIGRSPGFAPFRILSAW